MAHDIKKEIRLAQLDTEDSQAVLQLHTYKSPTGIFSVASVSFAKGGFMTFEMFGDYRKTLKLDRTTRGTQKAIDMQHAQNFTSDAIAQIIADVIEFYRIKRSKNA